MEGITHEVVHELFLKAAGKVSENGKHQAEISAEQQEEELNRQSRRMQELIEQLSAHPDPETREMVQECVQEMLSFYGKGLEKILTIIAHNGNTASKEIYNKLIEDSLVSGLLLIHDLHPLDLKTRLHRALAKVRPYMDSHGGSVKL
jgi:hypothetical protein